MANATKQAARLCACGCGEPTNPAKQTDSARGYVKGEPMPTLQGHAARVRSRESIPQRYRVNASTGCWEWLGVIGGGGYGRMKERGRQRPAHRVIYEWLVAPVPAHLELDHLCRNRACVNPQHLEPVTRAENNRRGFSASAINIGKPRCDSGHDFTPENTYNRPDGARHCRTCRRAWDRKRRAALRAHLEKP